MRSVGGADSEVLAMGSGPFRHGFPRVDFKAGDYSVRGEWLRIEDPRGGRELEQGEEVALTHFSSPEFSEGPTEEEGEPELFFGEGLG